jgi:hypothetical protein
MTRQRDIPSIQYRSPGVLNMTLPQVANNIEYYEVRGAARLVDAYGPVAGVPGFGALPMFRVANGGDFRSPAIHAKKLSIEESNRKLTRMVIDLDDYATPVVVGASYLASDEVTSFLRVAAFDHVTGLFLAEGPIVCVPPYDFFSTKGPIFTVTAKAPNLATGAFPGAVPPDSLPSTVMNFMLPAYTSTISVTNLEAAGGPALFVSFHPGVPPTVVMPTQEISLTGAGSPEFFVASPSGNPYFTVRCAVVNSA